NIELNDGAVPITHKAVSHTCPVNIVSCDLSICIYSPRNGTLKCTWDVTGVRSIERGDCAFLIQQETVIQTVRVSVDSHDGSVRSKAPAKGTLTGTHAGARNIECGDDALLISQETVDRIGPRKVEACDLSTLADCEAESTLVGSRTCPRRSERGDNAIPIPQETVIHGGRINVPSRDRPVGVDD